MPRPHPAEPPQPQRSASPAQGHEHPPDQAGRRRCAASCGSRYSAA
ncbi:hypothetical protein ACFPRL_34775 [Pseudoclavibacter helvolus]